MNVLSANGHAALEWAGRGWSVFLLQPGGKAPLVSKDAGGRGVLDATRDPDQITNWWLQHPHANIGGALGDKVVVDADPKNGGHLTLQRLVHQYGPLVTEHHLGGQYQTPEGLVRSHHFVYSSVSVEVGRLRKKGLGQGIDLLHGPGLYIVLPPSRHPSGVEYELAEGSGPIPGVVPQWIINLGSKLPDRQEDQVVGIGLAAELSNPPAPGERNDWWTRVAGHLALLHQYEDGFCQTCYRINDSLPYKLERVELDVILASIWESEGRGEQAKIVERAKDIKIQRRANDLVKGELAGEGIRLPEQQFASLAELVAAEIPEPTWCIESLAQVGHNLVLTAQYKTGKTTMVINLIRCLADQEPFLGQFVVGELTGKVGFLDYEMGLSQHRQWLMEAGIRNQEMVVPLNLKGYKVPLLSEQGQDALLLWLIRHEIKYLVIDPWGSVLRQSGLSENSNDDVGLMTDALDSIKEAHPLDLLLVTSHTGRAKQEEGEEHVRGATRLDDWADARWVLTRNKKKQRFLAAEGRDIDLEEGQVAIDGRRLRFDGDVSRATEREIEGEADEESGRAVRAMRLESLLDEWHREHPGEELTSGKTRQEIKGIQGVKLTQAMEDVDERGRWRRVEEPINKSQSKKVWRRPGPLGL